MLVSSDFSYTRVLQLAVETGWPKPLGRQVLLGVAQAACPDSICVTQISVEIQASAR